MTIVSKGSILKEFELFNLGTGGIGDWLSDKTSDEIFERLIQLDSNPLTKVQLNQILVLGHQAPISDDCFQYYWTTVNEKHPYDVRTLPDFQEDWLGSTKIESLRHLKWGLYRLFVDGLLWFGNVRAAFRFFRSQSLSDLCSFFEQRRFDTEKIKERGPGLPLKIIAKDDRYLVSEIACKSYGERPDSPGELEDALLSAFRAHRDKGGHAITIRKLLEDDIVPEKYLGRQAEFIFSVDDVLEESVASEEELERKFDSVASKFFVARNAALSNTRAYLSVVGDLDVYVATSMRRRQDFRNMADFCEGVFSDERLKKLQLRYFDPTLSAAVGHEDKGLIECLMVKCTKVLVYCAGETESYGKDAEAAMALSLGKPVIFYCDHAQKTRFYRDIHPLSRLVEFATGVAVGAMVTDSRQEVAELLYRIFENRMEYRLEQPKPGYLRLRETLTDSVIRLQTNDQLLNDTFWNHYHANIE